MNAFWFLVPEADAETRMEMQARDNGQVWNLGWKQESEKEKEDRE